LPVTPKAKGDLTARYTFPVGAMKGHVQGSAVFVGPRWADLRTLERQELGREPGYMVADFSAGLEQNGLHGELYVSNAFDRRAVLDRYAECDADKCGQINRYDVPNQPRTVGIKFGQKF
jgi:outer membrane receptor protein involved in Fe transport